MQYPLRLQVAETVDACGFRGSERGDRDLGRILRTRLSSGLVATGAFEALVALLRLDRQCRDRARFEALQRNRLAGFLAVAVGAVVDRLERLVDLGDELAEAITGTQFEGAIGLGRGAVGEVGLRQ